MAVEIDARLAIPPEPLCELAAVVGGVADERSTDSGPGVDDVAEAVALCFVVPAPPAGSHDRGKQRIWLDHTMVAVDAVDQDRQSVSSLFEQIPARTHR